MSGREAILCSECGEKLGEYAGKKYHTVIETPHVPPGYIATLCDSCQEKKHGEKVTPEEIISIMNKVIEAAQRVIMRMKPCYDEMLCDKPEDCSHCVP